ncbi:hypothetical protein LTR56_000035 [Elasticomyces elasticus]|nr:hypothetical protein LTR22_016386 [Elasticomyces elasticus]KAK3661549.1 hypothetical protein LTR56_000035 [Elasticomyces elasticus]KAK4932800.1 hypothetical protein LTR49_000754 [Elasticomyces elasticus]KAK5758245.1 hypothetical protein LTS12_011715 [Elasticomyces elasticus]
MSSPKMTINIIGAGLSGLVFGRCLRKRGIPFTIYDRDTATQGSTRHKYGITLYPWAFRPLLKYLDIDEITFRKTLAVDAAIGGVGRIASKHDTEDGPPFRANRRKLERMLSQDMDVKWGHGLEYVETKQAGYTTYFLKDHDLLQSWHNNLAIAADGPHSHFRKELAPKSTFKILPYAVYNGKRRVEAKMFEELYAPHMQAANVIERRLGQTLLQITVNERTEDLVSISYTYSRPAKALADALFKPERSTSGASQVPDELFAEIASLEKLDGPFKDVFNADEMRKDRLLNWLMRSVSVGSDELHTAAEKGVALIGDAAHATPILGGYGANAAIRDGVELAEFIFEHEDNDLEMFYEQRHRKWQSEVQASEAELAKMHGQATPSL